MSEQTSSTAMGGAASKGASPLKLHPVPFDAPWGWLEAGWRDLWAAPRVSLAYGAVFAALGYFFALALLIANTLPYLLPLAGGFLLVSPLLAVGLYDISRRHAAGEPITFNSTLGAWRGAKGQLAFFGVLLLIIHFFWMRLAFLLFMMFYGTATYPPMDQFLPWLLFTQNGLGLLLVGTTAGGALALLTFAVSVISVPMLLDKKVDTITAIISSVRAVVSSPRAMLLWAGLIAALMAVGVATIMVGLVVIFPLIGHATWHAYQAVTAEEGWEATD